MKEVEIKMILDTTEAVKEAKNLDTEIQDVGETAGKTEVGFGIMSGGIRAVGIAFKSAGIGLIVAAVAGLTEAFSRNKKVMDTVSIVMGTIQEVFSQVLNALIGTYEAITSTSDNFDALGRVIDSLVKLTFNPFIIAAHTLMLGLNSAALAYQTMFGDAAGILKAQEAIDQTKQTIKELASETKDAGTTLVDSFSEAIDEVGNIGTIISEEFSEVSITTANATAKAYKEATDAALLAQSQSSRLVAQYERQSELQRQLRDDTSLSVDERIKANNELGAILDKQEKAMLKQADAIIAGARAELLKNDSIENQAALVDALAQKEQVVSDITGKRSEQLVNEVGLLKEKKDLEIGITDGIIERGRIQREFDAEQEVDPLTKLQKQKDALILENELILEDLEAKRLLYAEGTAERLAAEEDYKNKSQDISNRLTKNKQDELDQREADEKAYQESIKNLQMVSVDAVGTAFNLLGQFAEDNKALQIASILGEAGANAAKIIMSTNVANIGALATPAAIASLGVSAVPVIAANNIQMGIGLANTAAAAVQGITALGGSGSPDTSGESTDGGTEAPSFNLVEGSEGNQIQNSIQNAGDVPVRAYVVAQDVTSQQSLDRQIESNSGI